MRSCSSRLLQKKTSSRLLPGKKKAHRVRNTDCIQAVVLCSRISCEPSPIARSSWPEADARQHNHGWIHRDVKSENILVMDKAITVQLADFDMATKIHGADDLLEICGTPICNVGFLALSCTFACAGFSHFPTSFTPRISHIPSRNRSDWLNLVIHHLTGIPWEIRLWSSLITCSLWMRPNACQHRSAFLTHGCADSPERRSIAT